ncbi:hypothetical protein BDN67DRAFT_1017948 [Paxillus ammoniavirescens]|nr:hypothetical protein BDN67DRAFT_1017948 [Paxillus ammoniavirescens]
MLDKSFTGGLEYLNESLKVSLDAAEEDQSEEIESLLNGLEVDDQVEDGNLREPAESFSKDKVSKLLRTAATSATNNDQLSINLKNASAGVVVDTTLSDYGRQVPLYWNHFKEFVFSIGKVKSSSDVDLLFPNIPADFPTWIALWIMDKCDENDIWTGKAKPPTVSHTTYGTAQKMCAAISHKFGHDYALGTQAWIEHPTVPGKYMGNPLR